MFVSFFFQFYFGIVFIAIRRAHSRAGDGRGARQRMPDDIACVQTSTLGMHYSVECECARALKAPVGARARDGTLRSFTPQATPQ